MENTYTIKKKIDTPIHLFDESLSFGGFTFYSYQSNSEIREKLKEGIVAEKDIIAEDFTKAYIKFLFELAPIVDAMSVLSQVMIHSLAITSFLIYRKNNNPDNIFYVRCSNDNEIVGMPIENNLILDIEKVFTINNPVAFEYLRESINAYTPTQKLLSLISASEAFAGTSKIKGNCEKCGFEYERQSTDKEKLKIIMGEDLYSRVYSSTRHKIAHGGDISKDNIGGLAGELYDRLILGYLKEDLGLTSIDKIQEAPRSWSYMYSSSFCKMEDSSIPSIDMVEDEWEKHGKIRFVENQKNY